MHRWPIRPRSAAGRLRVTTIHAAWKRRPCGSPANRATAGPACAGRPHPGGVPALPGELRRGDPRGARPAAVRGRPPAAEPLPQRRCCASTTTLDAARGRSRRGEALLRRAPQRLRAVGPRARRRRARGGGARRAGCASSSGSPSWCWTSCPTTCRRPRASSCAAPRTPRTREDYLAIVADAWGMGDDAARGRRARVLRSRQPRRAERRRVRRLLRRAAAVGGDDATSRTGSRSAARRRRSGGPKPGQRAPAPGPPGRAPRPGRELPVGGARAQLRATSARGSRCARPRTSGRRCGSASATGRSPATRATSCPWPGPAAAAPPMTRADGRCGDRAAPGSARRGAARAAADGDRVRPRRSSTTTSSAATTRRRSRARLWSKCAEIGLLGLPVPAEYGGARRRRDDDRRGARGPRLRLRRQRPDLLPERADVGRASCRSSHFGTEEQRSATCPGCATGRSIGAHAMTEPGSGSDAFSLTTTAAATGDGWVLNGSKTFVTNAPRQRPVHRLRGHRSQPRLRRAVGLPARARHPGSRGRRPILEDGAAHLAPRRAVPHRLRGAGPRRCWAARARAWRSSTTRCAGSAA